MVAHWHCYLFSEMLHQGAEISCFCCECCLLLWSSDLCSDGTTEALCATCDQCILPYGLELLAQNLPFLTAGEK